MGFPGLLAIRGSSEGASGFGERLGSVTDAGSETAASSVAVEFGIALLSGGVAGGSVVMLSEDDSKEAGAFISERSSLGVGASTSCGGVEGAV